ncbi:hypothetical protein M493_16940 [Geobacillus genomosp. 3]|uniref:Uncharacterized protein n=1 Tax=Geobacillus genomosp. 3 TaxID=1921421 RepID=S5ZSV5_GEOG3|nr:hypothetical protein M493_16940 [Geobacillus genomosp. 3]
MVGKKHAQQNKNEGGEHRAQKQKNALPKPEETEVQWRIIWTIQYDFYYLKI